MYSNNDYRYYLENQLYHSDDFLAHYGVKGMKWKQRLAGVNEVKRSAIGARDGKLVTDHVARNAKNVADSIPTPKERKKRNRKIYKIRKKYGLYREKPKGEKVKGSKNIYISHE